MLLKNAFTSSMLATYQRIDFNISSKLLTSLLKHIFVVITNASLPKEGRDTGIDTLRSIKRLYGPDHVPRSEAVHSLTHQLGCRPWGAGNAGGG
mmetsp:Transcript_13356/g.29460  ORF Transcript_13356/g.29460 Transcript_13356/m.29460 type:complete len:94 (-) Transcript_13356:504-785(-)